MLLGAMAIKVITYQAKHMQIIAAQSHAGADLTELRQRTVWLKQIHELEEELIKRKFVTISSWLDSG